MKKKVRGRKKLNLRGEMNKFVSHKSYYYFFLFVPILFKSLQVQINRTAHLKFNFQQKNILFYIK